MTFEAWFTLATVMATGGLLIGTRVAADLIMVGALTILIAGGAITPDQALAGAANPGLATVAVLYVVVAGLTQTGAVHVIGAKLLGKPRSLRAAQVRLMAPAAALSGFLNNTPLVALLVPAVSDWARRYQLPVSKLMIPLSYAAILGGTCTLIGTSTNLITHGLMQRHTDLPAMGFFEIGAIGLPATLLGLIYITTVGRWLLPDRTPPLSQADQAREYLMEMLVEPDSPLVGKTIEEAGLRNLPGAFLAEIERGPALMPAVEPTERLFAGDRLLFVGIVDSIVDLVRQRGLSPAHDQLFKLDTPRAARGLFEVVVSDACPIVGRTIREGRFRNLYGAVVIAVARNGERLRCKVGHVRLRPGDTLLVEARPSFAERHCNSRHFLLTHRIAGAPVPRHDRAWVAMTILAMMVGAAATGLVGMFEAALIASGLMVLSRCTSGSAARNSIDWQVLTVIGASLGVGQAMTATGAAGAVAQAWVGLAGESPWLALAAVYLLTNLFTEMITNNAAAVLVFPIALSTAESLGVSMAPFVAVIMMAASASFATPIGYQTNLMVYGPGGYRFTDYIKIGLPLNLMLAGLTVALAPAIWPF